MITAQERLLRQPLREELELGNSERVSLGWRVPENLANSLALRGVHAVHGSGVRSSGRR